MNPLMAQALDCARRASQTGDVPVGAVVVKNGQVVGTGWNRREADHRVTAHAEILAIEAANRTLGSWRLDGCDLYVTLEPCSMCASAIMQARMRAVYFGAWDPKAGAAGSVMNLFSEPWVNHRVVVYEGIMEQACRDLLDNFFKELRKA
jgi:tRNA(adenine34) deaminase